MTPDYSPQSLRQSRLIWKSAVLLVIVLAAGYGSRRYAHFLPVPIRKRTGDALWAGAIFVLISILRPRWSTFKSAVLALLISYLIEFSQLYHAPWIDEIRKTLFGRLVLGTTFFWLDQLAYTIGVACMALIDFFLIGRRKN